jgi:general secretion pathway protein G
MVTMAHTDERAMRYARAGFSLMEIMIAVMILGLIMGLVGPKVFQMLDNAKITTARSEIKSFKDGITMYKENTGVYPQKLIELGKRPKDEKIAKRWKGPYVELEEAPEDPWVNKYYYKVNSEGSKHPYELLSYGPNGKGSPKEEHISVWDAK